MRKTLVALGALLVAAPALGADLPNRREAPAYVVTTPVFTWSGVYVGVNAGYTFGNDSLKQLGRLSVPDFQKRSGTFGATIGAQYQVGNIVFGAESDINYNPSSASQVIGGATLSDHPDFMGTARLRLGYAFGTVLPYVTGGAYMQTSKASIAVPGTVLSSTDTSVGWVVGGGVEWALTNNWSIKGEYLYARAGDAHYTFTTGGIPLGFGVSGNQQIARGGINYRF